MTALANEEQVKICPNCLTLKRLIAAGIFTLVAIYLATVVPTIEIAWVSAILLLSIYLFAFELIEVDVASATVMVLLGLTSAPAMGLEQGLVDTKHLFDGFSSNAVISIITVMIIGAGLFLPVVSRISTRSGLPMSRLLMPMGFTGILYFVIAGRFVLPSSKGEEHGKGQRTEDYFEELYGVDYAVYEVVVPAESPLVGKNMDEIEADHAVRVVAVEKGDGLRFGSQGVDRSVGVEAGTVLGLLADELMFESFRQGTRVQVKPDLEIFSDALVPSKSGIAEVVIPPGSSLIGKTARDVWLRKTHGLSLLAINRAGETITREGGGVRDTEFQAGDALVAHTTWADLAHLATNRDFVVITTEYPHEELRPNKLGGAGLFFGIALFLVLFTDLRLSVALLTGAIGMILSRVLTIDEAYRAVSWKTVFLLASLIPTHQVNALIMGPGGYRVPDFMRAGGIMTILFLVVMMFMMNLVF